MYAIEMKLIDDAMGAKETTVTFTGVGYSVSDCNVRVDVWHFQFFL